MPGFIPETATRDHRLFERFPSRFPVKFKHESNEFGTNVFLRDASAQGVRVATRVKLFQNDNISLLVEIPGTREPLELSGRVAWTHSQALDLWDVGIEFHKVNLMKVHRLFRFLDREE